MARGWLRAIADTDELRGRIAIVGLVDRERSAAERLKSEFALEGAVTGSQLEDVLPLVKPDLLFDVATPDARRDLVLSGFENGCHVLTEKPMAQSLEDARAMLKAAETAGRTYGVAQNRRYNEGVRRVRETIATGLLGELTELHADFFIGAHFGGFREQMRDVLLLDMAIHTLDAARFMAGKEPLAVYAVERNPKDSWYAHGAAATAIYEFSDDVIFTYRGSWVAEGAPTSWEARWRIVGTNGT